MGKNKFIWTVVAALIAIAISLAFAVNFYGDLGWYRSLTAEDYAHLTEVRTRVQELAGKKNVFIVLKDGTILLAPNVRAGKINVNGSVNPPPWPNRKDLGDDQFLTGVARLVDPEDLAYDHYAVEFVTQK